VLGRIPGTTSWVPLGTRDAAAPVPGVLVVLFATALWYANAVNFRAQLRRAVAADPDVRLVVLDAAGMTDIDYTGCRALSVVLDDLARRQIAFGIARAGAHVRENLARGGLLERIGDDNLFAAVDGAVAALSERTRTTQPAAP
jgi:SulP family sulfate permease